jgi:iron(III) transport system ATP-binding protein
MSTIEITGLAKAYGPTPVLRSVELTVPSGSVTAVLGASGSGKSTLLRIIAGFEHADSGQVRIAGQLVDDGRRSVAPRHRGVGYVPQDAALFPHLSVAGNIGFGVPRRQRTRLGELVELVGLTGLERRYPHQLSGGQQHRVALARALAIEPRVVLLDEPFSSLDAGLRESVAADVAAILERAGATAVLVTHDQDEALSMAGHLAVLDAGRIVAHGRPRDLYETPPRPEIATAIGTANVLPGRLDGDRVLCVLGALPVAPGCPDGATDCRVLIRPERIAVRTTAGPAALPATIARVRYHGHDTLLDLVGGEPGDTELVARIAGQTTLRPGTRVWLEFTGAPPHVWVGADPVSAP